MPGLGGAWSGGDLLRGVPGPRGSAWGVPGLGGLLPGVPGPGGAWSRGVPGPGGAWSRGVPGGDPPPPDGYCCGWYASYWNAFLCSVQPCCKNLQINSQDKSSRVSNYVIKTQNLLHEKYQK